MEEELETLRSNCEKLLNSFNNLTITYTDLNNAYATALQRIDALSQELSSLRNLVLTLIIAVAVLATLLIIALLRK